MLIGLAVLATVGVVVWTVWCQTQPVYQGKPLTYWLKGFEPRFGNPGPPRHTAEEAVRRAGTNAIPILLRMLRTKDSDWRQKLRFLAHKQHFVEVEFNPSAGHHWVAREAFHALGSVARYAIPQLVEINQAELSGIFECKCAGDILDQLEQQDNETIELIEPFRRNAKVKQGR